MMREKKSASTENVIGTTVPEQYRTQTAAFELTSKFCERLIREVTRLFGEVFTPAS